VNKAIDAARVPTAVPQLTDFHWRLDVEVSRRSIQNSVQVSV
jgi:hypothetical protein